MQLKLVFLSIIYVAEPGLTWAEELSSGVSTKSYKNDTAAIQKLNSRRQYEYLIELAKSILRQDVTAYGDKYSNGFVSLQDDALGSDEEELEDYKSPDKNYNGDENSEDVSHETLSNELASKEREEIDSDEFIKLRDQTNQLIKPNFRRSASKRQNLRRKSKKKLRKPLRQYVDPEPEHEGEPEAEPEPEPTDEPDYYPTPPPYHPYRIATTTDPATEGEGGPDPNDEGEEPGPYYPEGGGEEPGPYYPEGEGEGEGGGEYVPTEFPTTPYDPFKPDTESDDDVLDDNYEQTHETLYGTSDEGGAASDPVAQSILASKPLGDKFSWSFGMPKKDSSPQAFANILEVKRTRRLLGEEPDKMRRSGSSPPLVSQFQEHQGMEQDGPDTHSVYGNLENLGNPHKYVPGKSRAIMSSGFRRSFDSGQNRTISQQTNIEKRQNKTRNKSIYTRLFESVPDWRIIERKRRPLTIILDNRPENIVFNEMVEDSEELPLFESVPEWKITEPKRRPLIVVLNNQRNNFVFNEMVEDSEELPVMDYRRKRRQGQGQGQEKEPPKEGQGGPAGTLRDAPEYSQSSAEKNPGNPYTIFKNKYQQNWPWKFDLDGDHMNINPYSPDIGNVMGPTGSAIFFNRKWWYFNQDDYKPFR